jgi:sulfoxide reductase catalytic subunit YedY
LDSRRHFIKKILLLFAGNGLFIRSHSLFVQRAWAKTKRTLLPKNTKISSLINRHPAQLDTNNLEVIPIEKFKTMGMTDHKVDLKQWRLQVTGAVQHSLELTYTQLLELPTIERNVLLICPGVFTNHGRWKGISVMELLNMAGAQQGITQVSFRGPAGRHSKRKRLAFNEIASKTIVFLKYSFFNLHYSIVKRGGQ